MNFARPAVVLFAFDTTACGSQTHYQYKRCRPDLGMGSEDTLDTTSDMLEYSVDFRHILHRVLVCRMAYCELGPGGCYEAHLGVFLA